MEISSKNKADESKSVAAGVPQIDGVWANGSGKTLNLTSGDPVRSSGFAVSGLSEDNSAVVGYTFGFGASLTVMDLNGSQLVTMSGAFTSGAPSTLSVSVTTYLPAAGTSSTTSDTYTKKN